MVSGPRDQEVAIDTIKGTEIEDGVLVPFEFILIALGVLDFPLLLLVRNRITSWLNRIHIGMLLNCINNYYIWS